MLTHKKSRMWSAVGFGLLLAVTFLPADASAQTWLDAAWTYRVGVTVDNSSNASVLTNYPVRVDLGTAFDFTHAQAAGEDVRFTAADGTTLLDYWIEFWDNVGDSAIVWVEVPSVPASSTIDVYMYYGNGAAADAADGSATFEFFDDFDSGTIDPLKWNSNGTPTVSGGIVTVNTASTYLQSVPQFQYKAMRTKARFATLVQYGAIGFIDGGTAVGTDDAMFSMGWTASLFTRAISSGPSGNGFEFGPDVLEGTGFKTWEIKRQSAAQVDFEVNDTLRHSVTNPLKISTLDLFAQINTHTGAPDIKSDWVLVRNYTSPEPGSTPGSEEINGPTTYQLTVTSTTGGTITAPASSPVTVDDGVATTITAVADVGYTFTGWTVETGSAAIATPGALSTTATLTAGDAEVQANFTLDTYQLTVSTTTGGTITAPVSSPTTVDHGVAETITAVADVGYTFTGWTVEAGSAAIATPGALSTTATLTAGDAEVQANFTLDTYQLTVSTTTGGSITAPGTSPVTVGHGVAETITAVADVGYTFTGWTVETGSAAIATPGALSTTATLTAGDAEVQANFVLGVIYSDDFNDATLDAAIWTFVDPLSDGGYTLSGTCTDDAWINISVPSGAPHEMWTAGIKAPHIVQDANDSDFELEVKFESSLSGAFQEQGILVKQDDANFMRFEFFSSASNTTVFAATLTGVAPPLTDAIEINTSIGATGIAPLYMRVNRTGNQWTQSYSTDGTAWTSAGSFTHALAVTEVGTYAGNAGASPAHTSSVDYFFNTASPVTPEDAPCAGTYQLTVSTTAGGTITAPPTSPVTVGAGVATPITVVADAGYTFTGWTVEAGSAAIATPGALSTTATLTAGDAEVQANFTLDTYQLTVSTTTGGTITAPVSSPTTVDHGVAETITAVADPGYTFTGWTVEAGSAAIATPGALSTTATLTAGDAEVQANFTLDTYQLTVSTTTGGTITAPVSSPTTVDHGVAETITAVADVGYTFTGWTVEAGSAAIATPGALSTTATLTAGDAEVQANFTLDTYQLTVSTTTGGSITAPGTSPVTVGHGVAETITAVADPGYTFTGWTVEAGSAAIATPGALSTTATLTAGDAEVQANFTLDTYQLTVSTTTGGTITAPVSSPTTVDHGVAETITAVADVGYTFTGWTVEAGSAAIATPGALSTTATLTAGDAEVQANFTLDTYQLTVSTTTGGSITAPGTSPVTVGHGVAETITAVADVGYTFTGWTVEAGSAAIATPGALSTTATLTAGDAEVQANFTLDTYQLTVSTTTGGTITAPVSSPTTVDHGVAETITAVADPGYTFTGWTVETGSAAIATPGALSTTATLTAGDAEVRASFVINTYTLTYTAGPNGGIVGMSPQTVDHGANGTQMTAIPNTGYSFVDWSDGVTDNPRTDLNVTADINVIANFAINTYTLTYTAGPNGTIVGTSPQTVDYGAAGTPVTATPNTGYHFVDWSDGGLTATRTDINVMADLSVTANFEIDTYTITATAGPDGVISPSGAVVVTSGNDQTFTMTPDPGFQVFNVLIDGVSFGSLTSYTFTNVLANHTIDVTFGPIVSLFTITATAGANGTITPSGPVVVVGGTNQLFTIAADPGYHILDVEVDGNPQGPISSYTFNNVSANHTISATFEIDMWTISASSGANGVITPNGAIIVNNGANQTFTITPDPGYHVLDVMVDGGSEGPVTSYTFTNVTTDHSISATFEIDMWTITATAGANGIISPSGPVVVNNGDNQTFTITPDPGYHVQDVVVDGGSEGAITTYTFTNVTADHSISVTFGIDTWNITASAGADGSINPVGTVIVDNGDDQTFTMTPDPGFRVLDVLVDGGSVGAMTSYTFTNVTADHTIQATFALNLWTITATAGPDGSITPSGAIDVNPGASQAFTIAADPGFGILDVVVDGGSVGAVSSYTFTNVTADHTIHATFIGVPAVITTSPVTTGEIAVLYNYDVDATGTPVPTYVLLSNPVGMTIDSLSGLVQWTPSAAGSFPVSLAARNSAGADTQTFAIQVLEPPLITTAPITDGVVGRLYTYNVDASGFPLPTYNLLTFPSGMTINPATGVVQWTPTAEGSFNVSVEADNAVGSDTQSYSITVIILPDIPTLISPANLDVTADGTPAFVWSATAGVGGTYTMQYSSSADFSSGVVEQSGLVDTTFTIASVDSLADGIWFWRVQAIDQLARISGYQPTPFLLTVNTTPPPVPVLLTPIDQAVINDNTPTLDWLNPGLSTVTYTLEYSSDSLFGSSVVVSGLVPSEFTISIPMADGDYFWHVSSTNGQGLTSGFQAVPFKFTVNTAAPPVPILLTPPHQTFTTYTTPRFSWLDVQPLATGPRPSIGHTPDASLVNGTYTLQYSTDSTFATYSEATAIPDTFYVIPDSVALAVTTWFWRVEKVSAGGSQSGFQSAFELGLFVPGDQVMDLGVTAADIIWLVNYVFKAGPPPMPCEAAGDVNCSGAVTSSDIIYLVNYVFKSGPPPCEIGDLIANGTWDCP